MAVLHRDGAEWQRRVAALELVIKDTAAATWAMALTADQDMATLGADEIFCYGVDSGTGTLADVAATYIGHTAAGQITRFVTDFGVLPAAN